MRVSVHGLKYLEPFGKIFASIVFILILGGFLIFEYTELSIFITYEILEMVWMDMIWIMFYGDFWSF